MVSINSIGFLLIYGVGLLVAYNVGKNNSKERYSKLIRRLHLNYRDDRLTKSSLLSDIPDIEEYLSRKRKRARLKAK